MPKRHGWPTTQYQNKTRQPDKLDCTSTYGDEWTGEKEAYRLKWHYRERVGTNPTHDRRRKRKRDGWIQRYVEQKQPDGLDSDIQPPPERDTNANSNGRKSTRTKRSGDHDSRTNGLIQSNRTEEWPRNDRNGLCPRRLERLKSDGSCNLTTGRPRSGHKEAGTESEPPDEAVDDDKWKWRRQRRQRWQRRWRHGRTTSWQKRRPMEGEITRSKRRRRKTRQTKSWKREESEEDGKKKKKIEMKHSNERKKVTKEEEETLEKKTQEEERERQLEKGEEDK